MTLFGYEIYIVILHHCLSRKVKAVSAAHFDPAELPDSSGMERSAPPEIKHDDDIFSACHVDAL